MSEAGSAQMLLSLARVSQDDNHMFLNSKYYYIGLEDGQLENEMWKQDRARQAKLYDCRN